MDKSSAPAFSIGHNIVISKPHNAYVPGPGAYDHNYTSLTASKSGANMYFFY